MKPCNNKRAMLILDRRSFFTALAAGAALAPAAVAQTQRPPAAEKQPSAAEPPRDWSGREPIRYPDRDIVALDNRFRKYMIGNTTIQRLHTGTLWAEGVAWNGAGRYLIWSDIPNNRQFRWLEEDGHVSVFRSPSGYSNGNTFDFEGRQLSCEHGNRRVVRYEPNGSVTVIADKWQGKPLNSPNDIVVHPGGAIYFTDPDYGIRGNYEGFKGEKQLKEAVYRVDPKTGKMQMVTDEPDKPNGLCFSPDYKKLYIADTGAGRDIRVWEVAEDGSLRNGRQFVVMEIPGGGGRAIADGIRADVDGNVWAAANPGVQILTPAGERIGVIQLPEVSANVCFGGSKRNRLFMAASQSLYAVYVGTQGAHIT
jgi:gluconolactonase